MTCLSIDVPRGTIDWDSRFWSKVHPEALSGCWLWHGCIATTGYGKAFTGSKRDGTARSDYAHRIAYRDQIGPIATGLVVRHRCDNRACVNPAHLEAGTQLENVRDAVERTAMNRGTKHGLSKLTDDAVRDIRASVLRGERTRDVAARHGVVHSCVVNIAASRRWRHVV